MPRDDRQQVQFVRQVFGRAIDDPAGYDLVLNVATLGEHAVVRTIGDALRHKLGAPHCEPVGATPSAR